MHTTKSRHNLNISDKKLPLELLIEPQTLVSIIVNDIKSCILFENEDHKIILANKMYCEVFDIPVAPEALIGIDHRAVTEQNKDLLLDPSDYLNRISKIIANKEPVYGDELELNDGRVLERDYIPISLGARGKGHLWLYNDVTVRKNYEKAIKIQVEKYRNIIANMNLGLMEMDMNDVIVSVNDIFCDISGYREDELIGRRALEVLMSHTNEKIITKKMGLRKHGFLDISQVPITNKKGEERWWLMSDAPNYDEKGKLIGSIGIHMDISEQKKMEMELEIAKKKAEDSSMAKETFLANMSHEIRTPMTGIMGIANLLSKTDLDDKQRKFTKLISESANNLLTIVNDVLDIEKIAAGKLDLESIPFKLEDKVFTTLQSFQFKAEDKNINLVLRSALPPDLVVLGDPYRLSQILNNLLSNALKFTPEGEISVTMHYKNNAGNKLVIEFMVEDTGIGIKPEKLGEIFSPFIQATNDTSRKYGGTGLGLTICKNLVEMQGGKIKVKSKIAEGTTFSFYIPYEKGNEAMLDEGGKEEIDYKNLEHLRILVAEDVELNQFIVKHVLESWGCDVTLVHDGQQAVEMVKKQNFDLILMDIHMPEMDGITATKAIRGLKAADKSAITKNIRTKNAKDNSATPIIALTANALKGDGQLYLDAGMNAHVTKPYTEEKLFTVISQIIKANYNLRLKLTHNSPSVLVENSKPTELLYDLTMINSIGKDDEAFTKKFINIFIESMQASLEGLLLASEAGNTSEISKIAHKMKSNIDAMNIYQLKGPIRELEAGQLEPDRERGVIDQVKKVLEEVFEQLQENM